MMHSRNSSQGPNRGIDKLDFDSHRRKDDESDHSDQGGLLRDDESLLSNIVDGVIESDRQRLRLVITKYISFASAILCCLCAGSITTFSLYGPLLQTHLCYTQFQVNAVSVAGEIFQYVLVPLFGFLCDRYSPRPLSLASAILLGGSYFLAAITYAKGPAKLGGWPYGTMVVAFVGIGMGTACLVISSVSTCAKNYAKSKYKGLALSLPIAAYGLSGMWLSQVASQLLYEPGKDGKKGDVNVYRYFIFLMGLLSTVGLIGALTLRVVNEEELINEAVSELERSGYLNRAFSHHSLLHDSSSDYGTISRSSSIKSSIKSAPDKISDAAKKSLVLNNETRRYIVDPTMWLLAAGVVFVAGPGETFINNLGTIIGTLYPASSSSVPSSNSPASNVSIVAIASTTARLLTGILSDMLCHSPSSLDSPQTFTISRLVILLTCAALLLLGQLLLASGLVQHFPNLFPLVSTLFGISYGGAFSLTPVIISIVWGARNFGTNWGIVMVLLPGGAAFWSAVYSAVYQAGADAGAGDGGRKEQKAKEVLCYGLKCYQGTFAGMAVCSLATFVVWGWAWRIWRRAGIPV